MNSFHATKSYVLILLIALMCAQRAQGLECYNCVGVPLDASCPSVTCPYSDAFCVTQVAETTVGSHKSKLKNNLCLPICPANLESTEILGTTVNIKTSCCKEDLCNAAFPTGGSTWITAGPGVLLFSLGSVFLQTFL
ncbi:lymphocyte antigen 6A-2/6E-1-like [Arvicanthis niloticus]|uniref:lymphocyte antigen 6A-2/6E-1-like n=1 Tax=Arvicanthis niloticus TaxID=61156 RepID=UPI0014866EDA|nr:lymphocyte antigen 6A-2/6E-1-like [Arvicanthis niloticus]